MRKRIFGENTLKNIKYFNMNPTEPQVGLDLFLRNTRVVVIQGRYIIIHKIKFKRASNANLAYFHIISIQS